ncbi:hypothetical protein [Leptospira mayottensis]|uniref:Uncharacterized protein n=2 Tax=Leptospira mayottensis TaxID=1137606 RepID=A0AA87MM87_9LEPT|nr:hypothetical protein [Leptospira mayottensis]AXR62692.1 hypothetical protein DQM68_18615 [Leptospira mayottensis]AXR66413.1 hypothetical protein DQM28_19610 [Leptospira mayottensis]AZQ04075.1 hypothetical protein LEP1GSC190_18690 [Leptospira mayottensis 200901116]EKS00010.1 hypothetical protein LEP1GSC125_3574 [Leptospira mayottensis 200901122]TGN11239.1 hypothetical protein EHR03_06865 [Leptospira mayottensis]
MFNRKKGRFFVFFTICIFTTRFCSVDNLKTEGVPTHKPVLSGEYYSKIQKLEEGYFVRQLFLDMTRKQNKFIFAQLSVTLSKNREETRIEGIVKTTNRGIQLIPESCRVFTNKESGNRWTLVRAYDCDHLSFQIESIQSNSISIEPDFIPGNPKGVYRKSASSNTNKISALVLESEGKILEVWGLRLSRVRKNATVVLEKENGQKYPVRTLRIVETTGQIRVNRIPIEKEDILLYDNHSEAGPLTY